MEVTAEHDMPRPTKMDWEDHRSEITDLYKAKKYTLPQVVQFMKDKYDFVATERIYKFRIEKWEATKKIDRAYKEGVAEGKIGENRSEVLIKVKRYVLEQPRTDKRRAQIKMLYKSIKLAVAQESASKKRPESPFGQLVCRSHLVTPSKRMRTASQVAADSCSSVSAIEHAIEEWSIVTSVQSDSSIITLPSLTSDVAILDPWTDLIAYHPSRPPSPAMSLGSEEDRSQRRLFSSIRDYTEDRLKNTREYKRGRCRLYYATSLKLDTFCSCITRGLRYLKEGAGTRHAWDRAMREFRRTKYVLPDVLEERMTLGFIPYIITTLSPSNTREVPWLRHEILRSIANAAQKSEKFGSTHPITTICDALHYDGDDSHLASIALNIMVDTIRDNVDPPDEEHYQPMLEITQRMRRTGNLDIAKQMAKVALSAAQSQCGEHSDQVRSLKAELAHIVAEGGDDDSALALRMDIATAPARDSRATKRGECGEMLFMILVMADIARYHFRVRSLNEGYAWWEMA